MSMSLILAGYGSGSGKDLTQQIKEAIAGADLVIGSKRLIESVNRNFKGIRAGIIEETSPEKIYKVIKEKLRIRPEFNIIVLYSGDTGFYSGAESLSGLLGKEGYEFEVMPGVSSIAYFASKTGRAYRDALLLSAHGKKINIVREAMKGRDMFILTDKENSPDKLCKQLSDAGLGLSEVIVGEKLSYDEEKITEGTACKAAEMTFEDPSVLFIGAVSVYKRLTPGIPDEEFVRGNVPMTKQMVRACVMAELDIGDKDICWDIGAGTGSVSVEMSLNALRVYSVERSPEAVGLIKKNREKFCAWNMKVIENDASYCIDELEAPDKVFIGGTGGKMADIITCVLKKNEKASVVISAITLETLNEAVKSLRENNRESSVFEIQISKTVNTGNYNMLRAENPVFVISSVCRDEGGEELK